MNFWQAFLSDQSRPQGVAEQVAAVQYQLCALFSSEAPLVKVAPQFKQVQSSNLCFGLNDFQTLSNQTDPAVFARQVEHWIKSFEPRLTMINVEVLDRDEQHNRISFSVEAQLLTDRGSQELTFDSSIDLSKQQAQLQEQEFV
ncbi:MAG: type VI secretion system baseplate subunit TssE [Pseudomonadales bacterium]|nr:type VI secretion system baseplate subunit TssE [Pseudomonadales bacterium]NRA17866.1 type VI secretion system baseplate subunit TssE [Oceanospirillaceae bacterium]